MAGLLYTHNPASTSSHCLPVAPSCNALKSLELLAPFPSSCTDTGSGSDTDTDSDPRGGGIHICS